MKRNPEPVELDPSAIKAPKYERMPWPDWYFEEGLRHSSPLADLDIERGQTRRGHQLAAAE